ncbi:transglutaminase domain-containing protein [Caldanaerobacter subterraneus]|uniref:Transglutaminase superfamily protein n=1 Tax=Caldanaerobacter subterraneus TaxID=911092 RepID=A0A4R2K2A1_9THEO|nr:transglutaminase domain-containing protein [Caldanaerobacter subterraneus]TCO60425.1 transglutaminase superfamily protein [Caldanaerobacter subterraneus]
MRKNIFWLILTAVIVFVIFFNSSTSPLIAAFEEKVSLIEQRMSDSKLVANFLSYLESNFKDRIVWDNGRLIIDFRVKKEVDEKPSLKDSLGGEYVNPLPEVTSEKDMYVLIKNSLENTASDVSFVVSPSFCGSNCSIDDVLGKTSEIAKLILSHHPELAYADKWSISASTYKSSSYKITITFNYFYPLDKVKEMKAETEAKAREIISKITSLKMTDLQKAKAIHDYIVKHTKYDYKNYISGTIPFESFTAYGVLIKGAGVCQGYTAAFNLLGQLAGLDSIGVSGTGIRNGKEVPHAWNMVRIDGKVRYIDVTWDDPVPDRGDKVMYTYFNLTEKQIEKDHKWNKEDFSEKYFDYK